MGEILVAFFGPDSNDVVQTAAMSTLLTYLAGSSISILENVMVEKEELASSIGYWWDARPNSIIWLRPTGVATEKLHFVEQRLFQLLKDVASKPLDVAYITDCLKRERRQIKSEAEGSDSYYADNIINDFVFGKRDGSTLKTMSNLEQYDILEAWTEEQWRAYLKKWISDAPHISLLGKPSKELDQKIKADEAARLAARKQELGPEGLQKLSDALHAAVAKNEAEIPSSIFGKFPIPGVESIHFIKSITARSGIAKGLGTDSNAIQKIIDAKTSDLSLFLQFEHVPTNFVHINILLGTSEILQEHRPLLAVFIDNFFKTPIIRNGETIQFEEVVTHLEQDTIEYSISSGAFIGDSEGLLIDLQIEPEKYAAAIEWIRTFMFDSIFDKTRLKASVAKILADLPQQKRKGSSMAWHVDLMLHMDNQSSIKARSTLVKIPYMKRLKKLLAEEPEIVISWLEDLRKSIFKFSNMRALVIANVEALPEPIDAWKPLTANLDTSQPLLPIIKPSSLLSESGKNLGVDGAVVVPIPAIDSSFCVTSAEGPRSYDDPRLPALSVAISFLEVAESPLWVAVRGAGLAYSTSFSKDLDSGVVHLEIYRSPDAYRAFAASKKVIENYIDGTLEFDKAALEGAISNIVVGLADEQNTMAATGRMSFVNTAVRELPSDYSTQMLKMVRAVTVDELKEVMRKILLPAMQPGTASVVVTCAPGLVEVFISLFPILYQY